MAVLAGAAGPLTAAIDLPRAVGSVPAARRMLAELLSSWAADRFHDDATLLLSELVTNVVRHVSSRSKMVLEVSLSEPRLRVAVVDASATPPATDAGRDSASGGHGLQLVEALADRWGSDAVTGGKRVWFELRGP
jgi:serine/threonine-protein kinase RsbW